jgi:hypothetical protein
MYTKRLKLEQFVQRVSPEDLKRLVLKGLASDALTALADAGKWLELLQQVDGHRREAIEAELYKVNDIADENGMRMLVDRLSEAGIAFDTEATPHRLALWCRTEHPAIFNRVYDRYWLEQAQSLIEYKAAEVIDANLSDATIQQLEAAIKEEAGREAEGRRCAIRSYLDDDRFILIVHHRGYNQVIEEVDESDQVVPRIVRPAEISAVIYDRATHRLKLHTRKEHVQERLRRLVGEHLFGNRQLFTEPECQAIYSLESLKDPGFTFQVETADPVEEVRLTELSLRVPIDTYPKVTVQTRAGVMPALRHLRLSLPTADLVAANVQFRFRTPDRRGKSLTVKVRPPNRCAYDHGSPNAHYAEKYLRKWQIARI